MPSLSAIPAGTIRLARGHPCPLIWEDRDAIWVRDDFRLLNPEEPPLPGGDAGNANRGPDWNRGPYFGRAFSYGSAGSTA